MDIVYRYDPHAPLTVEAPGTAQEALDRLAQGNARYSRLVERMQAAALDKQAADQVVIPVTPLTMGIPLASGLMEPQRPYAMVLGCSDARAPVEHIFDCGANEVFVVRVAGNVLGLECLGSVDYAVSQLSETMRTGIVLGHTGCGAVTAAVDMYLAPSEYTSLSVRHPVRSLVDRIMLAVRAASRALNERFRGVDPQSPEHRERLITTAVYLNAAVTAFDVSREVHDIVGQKVGIAYSVYNVSRSRVSALPLTGADGDVPAFLASPQSANAFEDLAAEIVARIDTADASHKTIYLT
ncbi:MAG: carbonic anhydrase [Planctomycetaceae bacterium]